MKKLKAAGYISGYAAQINVAKLGQTFTVFTEITLKNHRQIDFSRFLSVLDKEEAAVECHLISGGYDYLVKFVTSGIGEYQTMMERLIDMDLGIDKYFSYVVLKTPIARGHMPLTKLFPVLTAALIRIESTCATSVNTVKPIRVELRHARIGAYAPPAAKAKRSRP